MAKARVYSRYSAEAAALLGKQIRLGRKQRRWSELELAGRAGISRATLQKIEKGDLSCAIGLVFELAVLTGTPLFADDSTTLAAQHERLDDKLALLPRAVRGSGKVVDDDF